LNQDTKHWKSEGHAQVMKVSIFQQQTYSSFQLEVEWYIVLSLHSPKGITYEKSCIFTS